MFFTKMHGLGNDFILVNREEENNLPRDLTELAIRICDRHLGVGADGLVLIGLGTGADLTMQIINSDGSEAEMCGNAIRCLAKYAYEQGLVQKTQMTVATRAGVIIPQLLLTEEGIVRRVRVDMGEPVLERQLIPMEGSAGKVLNELLEVEGTPFKINAVSMGNPHCVIFVPDLAQLSLEYWGSRIGTHPSFPFQTNVEFIQVLNRQTLQMAVWERGAGITLACGTGACAAVVAAVLNDYTDSSVEVKLAKGSLEIEWSQNNHIYMTGSAQQVFTGEIGL